MGVIFASVVSLLAFAGLREIFEALLGPGARGPMPFLLAITGSMLGVLRLHAYFAESGRKSSAVWQQTANDFGLEYVHKVYIFKRDGWDGELILEGSRDGRRVRVLEECDVEVGARCLVVAVDGAEAWRGGAGEVRDALQRLLGPGTR